MSWLFGGAVLAVIVGAIAYQSEEQAFAQLLGRAQPGWLLAAFALQALTYLAQGEIWRAVARRARVVLPRAQAYRLSLAKLFVDQALPAMGITGTALVAGVLQRAGLSRPVVMAGVVVNLSSHFLAYVLALAVALSLAHGLGRATGLVVTVSVLFALASLVLAFAVPLLSGRYAAAPPRVARIRWLARGLQLLREADPALARDTRLLGLATALQLGIVLLDCLTVWVLIRSVGASAPLSGVFASFMIASVLRSVSIVPGGLGFFEAASVLTLQWTGVSLATALAATLMFRGLSFWLPMLPGLAYSRSALRAAPRSSSSSSSPSPSPSSSSSVEGFWARSAEELFRILGTGPQGLSTAEAAARLERHGANQVGECEAPGFAAVVARQFRSPLMLILVVAAVLSLALRDWLDASIVLAILFASAVLSAVQEHRASNAIARLRARVSAKAVAVRDGVAHEIPAAEVVPGDIVRLAAGSLIPADGRLLDARDCFVNQGLLTGETFPVEKQPGTVAAGAALAGRTNCVFQGTSVRSGTATVLIVRTGTGTEVGQIADVLARRAPETEFEHGLRRFGGLLVRVMLLVVVSVLAFHMLWRQPSFDSVMFALALAVGMSPELLPAILTLTLARGAQRMAQKGVIVRRLNAIENLGSMDVLCTDKTGTLTRGVVQLDAAVDVDGADSDAVLRLACLNAHFQTGLPNPLDEAIAARACASGFDAAGFRKLDEIPYDFARKCLSVVVAGASGEPEMITKGALEPVLTRCDRVQRDGCTLRLDDAVLAGLRQRFEDWSRKGYRVLGLAHKPATSEAAHGREDEAAMVFAGFLLFFDPPEPQVVRTLRTLRRLGVRVKIITGDNRLVARHVAEAVGLTVRRDITGAQLAATKDEALWHLAPAITLFSEVDPNQKERIIRALQKTGHIVGYLGDGINDAPALHAADVGISVDSAVDVARQAADFVLLRHDLDVLRQGIDEGRHTFANTLKYIYITTSANFGNMISMALASLALPFLPLLAPQILLNNLFSDIPALGIAGDRVDREWRRTPHRWDLASVRRFMIGFGLLSSAFDVATFALLLFVVQAGPELFRTGWFLESLLTEIFIIFVVRTYKPFYRSRPGRFVLWSAITVAAVALALPYVPAATVLGFVPLPPTVLAMLLAVSVVYALVSEAVKRRFYPRISLRRRRAR